MPSSKSILAANERFLTDHGHDIQAGIFTPHRFDHVLLLFLQLEKTTEENRKQVNTLLRSLANNSHDRKGLYLCTTAHQRAKRRKPQREPDIFCNLFLTAEGLQVLDVDRKPWQEIVNHLTKTTADLENAQATPEDVHAVLLLAHPKADALLRKSRELEDQYFKRIGITCLSTETGRVYRRRFDPGRQQRGFAIEHFGYADGLSNPWVTEQDTRLKGRPRSRKRWDPTTSYEEFVVPEPGGANRWGSYLVYRKYQQDPAQFAELTKSIAKATGKTEEEAGALLFGRRQNGSSLEFEAGSEAAEERSDFTFSPGKCPLFAHTRKVNGRDQPADSMPKTPEYPILRRGITYGERSTDPYRGGFSSSTTSGTPVGLLFMSFQNDIGKFQQLLQQSGSDPADPLLGNLGQTEGLLRLDLEGVEEPLELPLKNPLITPLGGLNLYAPSISFFRSLPAQDLPSSEVSTDTRERGIGRRTENLPLQINKPMEPILVNIPVFGQDRYAFFYALKYYNDTKVGYDGAIAAYATRAAYSVRLPQGPTVPVRDQRSLRVLMTGLQGLEESQNEALGFSFEVPLRKGHEANIDVTLTSWDGTEILASQNIENCYFNGPDDKSSELMDANPEDEYGFVRIVLNKFEDDDLTDPDRFLQNKIERWWNKPVKNNQTPAIIHRLFILRVTQIVWRSNLKPEAVKSSDFECRDDSIILEIQEGD